MTTPKITIYPNALPGFANGNMGSSGYVPSYGRNPLLGAMNPVPPMMAAMDANPVRDAGMLNQSRYNAKLALPQAPNNRIGFGEALLRMGAAGLTQDITPANQMLGAAGGSLGDVMQANRKLAMEDYNAQIDLIKALAKAKGKDKKKAGLNIAGVPDTASVMNNINRALPEIQADIDGYLNTFLGMGGMKTGFIGGMLSLIGGTAANDLNSKLETIKGNIGFDKLQRMRDASPTGGALGQVSQMELGQLNASLGNLNVNQTPEQLKQNLIDVKKYYQSSVQAIYNQWEQSWLDGKVSDAEWEVVKGKLAPALQGTGAVPTQPTVNPQNTGDMSDEELLNHYNNGG